MIYVEIPKISMCIVVVFVQTSLKTDFRGKDVCVENYFLVCSSLEIFLLYL